MLVGVLLGAGCALTPPPSPPARAPVVVAPPPPPTALTAEAEAALNAAERNVAEARDKRILWSSAMAQLDLARSAAKSFDSATTLARAKEVSALCELAARQTSAPPVKW